MEMHQVRYFLAVARTRNFTRAADACNVTQPSLTRAIQKLEAEFGGPLFRRERALTHLTDLGRLMLPHLERAYEAAQQARALARSVERAELMPLSLGLADDIALDGLAEIIGEMERSFPGFALTLVIAPVDQLLVQAMRGEIDTLIAPLPEARPERLDCWPLAEERLGLLLPPGDPRVVPADTAPLAPEALASAALVTLAAPAYPDAAALLPDAIPRHRAGSAAAAAMMVSAGLGIAILGEGAARAHGLAFRPLAGPPLQRTLALAAVAGRQRSPATDAFMKSARARAWATA
jgi:DNA-binding transcriptional LysR family regulator